MLKLTKRQSQCWLLRSRGLSNKEIADALEVGISTVESHFARTMETHRDYNPNAFLCEFVREQCRAGVWE